jgi:hypothetical protein
MDLTKMTASNLNESKVICGKRVKRVTLQRAIASKIAHFPEEVTFKDVLILVDNLLWLQDKALKDPIFREKFGVNLKVLTLILKHKKIWNPRELQRNLENISSSVKYGLSGFLLEKRNVKNVLKQQYRFVEVRRPQSLGTLKSSLPPERYIGIGYRDKGSAKQPHLDGSPSWQEIASSNIEDFTDEA